MSNQPIFGSFAFGASNLFSVQTQTEKETEKKNPIDNKESDGRKILKPQRKRKNKDMDSIEFTEKQVVDKKFLKPILKNKFLICDFDLKLKSEKESENEYDSNWYFLNGNQKRYNLNFLDRRLSDFKYRIDLFKIEIVIVPTIKDKLIGEEYFFDKDVMALSDYFDLNGQVDLNCASEKNVDLMYEVILYLQQKYQQATNRKL